MNNSTSKSSKSTASKSSATKSTTSKSSTSKPKATMDSFKTEVASELGVNLKDGYNGDLTSREAGSIGGEMVKRMVKKAQKDM